MSLKYIFFNFAQLKLSVAYDSNFAADKIRCQTSVYGLITFCSKKKIRAEELKGISIKCSYLPSSKGVLSGVLPVWISLVLCMCFTYMKPDLLWLFCHSGQCRLLPSLASKPGDSKDRPNHPLLLLENQES